MYDVRDVANYVLSVAEVRKAKITNLALQKLLYFIHGWYFAMFDRPLLKNKFEAWKYGPVQRVLYEQFRKHEDRDLRGVRATFIDPLTGEKKVKTPEIDQVDQDAILLVLDKYIAYSASQLVNESHVEDGPWEFVWKQAEDAIYPGMKIPDELISLHFKRLPQFILMH